LLRVKILLFGARGQLGLALQRSLPGLGEVIALSRNEANLLSPDSLVANIRSATPDAVVNAAAYTAVDKAESDADAAHAVNAVAPGAMAEACRDIGALFVHYSTDYVYDGSKAGAYVETDPTNPLSVYGATKLAGEDAVRAAHGRHLIFRTSWVYSHDGANFMKTMLRLAQERDHLRIVDDQIGAPTTTDAIARATVEVLRQMREQGDGGRCGLYHLTCGGRTSWFGFANAIFAGFLNAGRRKQLVTEPIPAAAYPTAAKRPGNSLLSNAKLKAAFGLALPDWQSALADLK
jgi:dTDP-4-dehydrorhamnose reductase